MKKNISYISSLQELSSLQPNAIIIDNLTMSSAMRLTAFDKTKEITKLYPLQEVEKMRGNKWNYDLNLSFRFAVDLACLAQLVQALILFDNIFVDVSHLDRWGKIRIKNGKVVLDTTETSGLNHVVMPFSLKRKERLDFWNFAYQSAISYQNSEAFKRFIQLLSISSVEAAYIHMSHNYFETGFSDRLLVPATEFVDEEFVSVNREIDILHKSLERQSINPDRHTISSLRRDTDLIGNSIELLQLDRAIRDLDETPNLMGTTAHGVGDGHDKHNAGIDILRNTIAANFYKQLSEYSGLPYFPHPLRSPLIAFEIVAAKIGLPKTLEKIMSIIESNRLRKAQYVNEFFKKEIIQLRVPFFLALVMQKAKSPREIFKMAVELRENKNARAFRAWFSNVNKQIESGNFGIKKLEREIKEIQSVLDEWSATNSSSNESLSVGININIGPLSISQKTFPRVYLSHITRPRHLRFLQSLMKISDLTPRFDSLIDKVFGKSVASRWSKYQSILKRFDELSNMEKNKRYSPLDPSNDVNS
jgi:hypothetical protein